MTLVNVNFNLETNIMNIHEHQAKKILKEFGIPVLNGVVIFDIKEIKNKIKKVWIRKM